MAKSRSSFIWKPIDFKYCLRQPINSERTKSYSLINSINRVRRNISKPVSLQVAEKLTEKVLDKLSTSSILHLLCRGTDKEVIIKKDGKTCTISIVKGNIILYTVSVSDHTKTIPYTTSIFEQSLIYSIKSVVDEVPNLL